MRSYSKRREAFPAWYMRKYGCKRNGQRISVTGKPLLSNPEHVLRVKGKNKWNKVRLKVLKFDENQLCEPKENNTKLHHNHICFKNKKHDTDRNVKKKKKPKKVPSRKLILPVRNRAAEDCSSTCSPCWSKASVKPQTRWKPSKMKIHQDHFNAESWASSTLTCTSRRVMKFSSWKKSPGGNLDVVKE